MLIKTRLWIRLAVHQATFEKRVKNLSRALLYTYWTSELDQHRSALMHPAYSQSHQEKNLPILWGLAEHFWESATENYPLPMMHGKENVRDRSNAMRSIIDVYKAFSEVYSEPPETSIHRSKKFQTILAEIRNFNPSIRVPDKLIVTDKILK